MFYRRFTYRRVARDVQGGWCFVNGDRHAIAVTARHVGLGREVGVRRLGTYRAVRPTTKGTNGRDFQHSVHVEIAVDVELARRVSIFACAGGVGAPNVGTGEDCECVPFHRRFRSVCGELM